MNNEPSRYRVTATSEYDRPWAVRDYIEGVTVSKHRNAHDAIAAARKLNIGEERS